MSQAKPCNSMGIQWGFWWWSHSEYKWIGGEGGGAPPPTFGFTDNFDDNVTDPEKWEKNQCSTCTATETGQKLECYIGADGGSAGYVTKNTYDFRGAYVMVDVDAEVTNTLYNLIYIAFSKVTASNPISLSDWIRLYLIKKTNALAFEKKVAGSGTSLYSGTHTGVTKLRIRLVDNILYADYYDGSWHNVWSGSPPHTYDAVYIYIVGVASTGQLGKEWFDNFALAK